MPIMFLHVKVPRHTAATSARLCAQWHKPEQRHREGLNVFEQRGGATEVQVETAHFEGLKKRLKKQRRKENAKN